jgi:hypothetical protein
LSKPKLTRSCRAKEEEEEEKPVTPQGLALTLSIFTTQGTFICHKILTIKVKVKQSRNRPGVAQRVPGCLGSQIS